MNPLRKNFGQLIDEHDGKISDKWNLYIQEWDRLLSPFRDQPINLLEIGIQNGGSLEIWAKYFQHAEKIIGCEVDKRSKNLRFEDSRIRVVVGDANTDASEAMILECSPIYDIIIDDGSHTSSDIIRSFARYIPHIADEGIYIVEDFHASYWPSFEGGLHNPQSSMAFFKRIADILNYEHWRNSQTKEDYNKELKEIYGINFGEG